MRVLLAICLAGGCSFVHGGPSDDTGGGGGGGGAGSPDAATPVGRSCDLPDSTVQLCLDFEAADLGLDSSAGHHDATVVGAVAMPRPPQEAAMLGTGASLHVAETTALDITGSITYEAWLNPSQRLASDIGVLDNNGQYALWMLSDGRVGCDIAGHYADSKGPLPLDSWTHVGCTYDSIQSKQITVYIDGSVSGCYQTSAPIATSGSSGTVIGGNFIGGVDNIHVLSRAVSPSEMCDHAGATDCSTDCGS